MYRRFMKYAHQNLKISVNIYTQKLTRNMKVHLLVIKIPLQDKINTVNRVTASPEFNFIEFNINFGYHSSVITLCSDESVVSSAKSLDPRLEETFG